MKKTMKTISRAVSLAAVAAVGFTLLARRSGAGRRGRGRADRPAVVCFEGVFGTYDRDALRRGYKVYKEVCAVCHSMQYVRFRNLAQPGGPEFSEGQVKTLAAEITVEDGPNSDGEMFERPGEPKDAFPSPYPNPEAAAAALGAVAPDLSLMTKARPGGARLCLFAARRLRRGAGRFQSHDRFLQQVLPRPHDRHAAAAVGRAGRL